MTAWGGWGGSLFRVGVGVWVNSPHTLTPKKQKYIEEFMLLLDELG